MNQEQVFGAERVPGWAIPSKYDSNPERTAALAKANHALRRVNSRLARVTDYNAILSVILTENAALMQAVDAAAYRYEPANACLRIAGAVTDAKPVATIPDHPFGNPSRPSPVAGLPCWRRWNPGDVHVSRFRSHVFDDPLPSSLDEWHRRRKHTLSLRSALAVGREPVGCIAVSFSREVEPDEKLLETFRALSQQVTLVLHMLRLSDAAKENAAKRAVIDERNRIARDMHDTLAHSFTGILMQLEAAKEFVPTRSDVVLDCIDRATAIARDGLRQSRQAVTALQESRPEPLLQSLQDLVAECKHGTKTECAFLFRGMPRSLPAEVDKQMFRICQEAFSNAQRYAKATKIEISVSFTSGAVVLVVEDDGVGFAPSHVGDIGFGLSGMRKRAERIGAYLTIDSSAEKGARVRLEWREPNA